MKINKKSVIRIAVFCVALMAVCMFSVAAQANSKNAGIYNGTFLGSDDNGWFTINIQSDGNITGNGGSAERKVDLAYTGTCHSSGALQFSTTDGSLMFTGHLDWMKRIFGRWEKSDQSSQGSFSAVSVE